MLWFLVQLCMHYQLFQLPDLNSASALSCCRCALTWYKFKLPTMSLANQIFCTITHGWALSEIKGCDAFSLPITGLAALVPSVSLNQEAVHIFTLNLTVINCASLHHIILWYSQQSEIKRSFGIIMNYNYNFKSPTSNPASTCRL